MRFQTDVVGDRDIKKYMNKNKSVPKIVKVGVLVPLSKKGEELSKEEEVKAMLKRAVENEF